MLGTARAHGMEIFRKCDKLLADPKGFMRAIFYGPPGCGKSELASIIALKLSGDSFAIEHLNGQGTSVERVRDWQRNDSYRPLYGTGWKVRIIDESDMMSEAGVFEMRQLMDARTPRSAYILTTNVLTLESPDPKEAAMQRKDDVIPLAFHTRCNVYQFTKVKTPEVQDWLMKKWALPLDKAQIVARCNDGNVRGACFDAEKILDRIT